MKNNIIHKKTFWMNVGLSIFSILGCLYYLIFELGIEEINKLEIVFDFFFLITPIMTVITLYENESTIFNKISLFLNIIVLCIYFVIVWKLRHESITFMLPMFVWMTPFIINVKQLYKLRRDI